MFSPEFMLSDIHMKEMKPGGKKRKKKYIFRWMLNRFRKNSTIPALSIKLHN